MSKIVQLLSNGQANTILISEKNYDLYKDTINLNDMLKKMDIVFGDVDDVFFI